MNRRKFIGEAVLGAVALPAVQVKAEERKKDAVRILFTGTGAADWPQKYPLPSQTFMPGGFRGNASIVLDDHILVDCGNTVPQALRYHGVDVDNLTDLFVTHSHGDHLTTASLTALSETRKNTAKLNVWGHRGALERVEMPRNMVGNFLSPMETVEVPDYFITALPANHVVADSGETPLHYLFEKNGTRVLYATDGAWLLKPLWLYLRDHPLDAVVFDATIGDVDGDWRIFEHNSLAMIRLMCDTLRKQNVLKNNADVILTHMARTLWSPHDSISASLKSEGLIMAWDGMMSEVK